MKKIENKPAENRRLLIGGAALVKMGSSRKTMDEDYLIHDEKKEMFFFDLQNNVDYCNAAKNKFFAEVWKSEAKNMTGIASPKALAELKAYAYVQHCQNFNWKKADEAEFDIKFLVRYANIKSLPIVKKHVSEGEYYEIQKVIDSVKFGE